ncbi:MAG: MCE family protein [Burkholderiales bacterium]|nr:MCE family protein [Burkholderiales bacterium]
MAPEPEHEDLPQATVEPRRRAHYSAIWAVPALAILVAIGIAVQRYLSEGPTISIVFKTADGVEAGKTFVKYKDVNIGQVTAVRLTEDLGSVEVTAKIAKSAAALMVEDARFWVVRPRISLSGISGLSTLLSGNYIGFEAGVSTARARHFTGVGVPPIVTGGESGSQFVLTARDLGSLSVSSPVYYRRVPVGQVIAYELAADGTSVVVRIFVNAPYDKFVTASTRFWNASGVDMSLSASGLDLRTQSLVSLLEGGIVFESPMRVAPESPAAADANFRLFADRKAAMKLDESIATPYVLHFSESVRGLSIGAPVTFFGVPVGEVTDVGLSMDVKTLEGRPRVAILVFPERVMNALTPGQEQKLQPAEQDRQLRHAFMRQMVERRGLRAQLMTGSLLTGQRYVSLGYFPKAPKARIDWDLPVPELPTIQSALPELEARLGNIVEKLERVPFDTIGDDLVTTLATLRESLQDARTVLGNFDARVVPALESTLEEARGALRSAEKMLTSTEANLVGASAPGQIELRRALSELARAARSLRVLADYLERHPESLIRGKPAESATK